MVDLGGGHGGGDPLLLDDISIDPDPEEPVVRHAGLADDSEAVLTGVAVHHSAIPAAAAVREPLQEVSVCTGSLR